MMQLAKNAICDNETARTWFTLTGMTISQTLHRLGRNKFNPQDPNLKWNQRAWNWKKIVTKFRN